MALSLHGELDLFYRGAVRRLVKCLTWDVCRFIAGIDLEQREREREEKGETDRCGGK